MFFLKQMTLRIKSVDNSVECIPQTQERDSKRKTKKNNSLPLKQDINISQNSKNC